MMYMAHGAMQLPSSFGGSAMPDPEPQLPSFAIPRGGAAPAPAFPPAAFTQRAVAAEPLLEPLPASSDEIRARNRRMVHAMRAAMHGDTTKLQALKDLAARMRREEISEELFVERLVELTSGLSQLRTFFDDFVLLMRVADGGAKDDKARKLQRCVAAVTYAPPPAIPTSSCRGLFFSPCKLA